MDRLSDDTILYLRASQGHSGGKHINSTLQDNALLPSDFAEHIYHVANSHDMHSIIESGLIPGGEDVKKKDMRCFLRRCIECTSIVIERRITTWRKPKIAVYKHSLEKHREAITKLLFLGMADVFVVAILFMVTEITMGWAIKKFKQIKVFRLRTSAIPFVSDDVCKHCSSPTHTTHARTRDFSRVTQNLSHRVRTHNVFHKIVTLHNEHSKSHAPSLLFPSHLRTTSLSTLPCADPPNVSFGPLTESTSPAYLAQSSKVDL